MFSAKVKFARVPLPINICDCFVRQNHNETVGHLLTKFCLVNFKEALANIPDLESNFTARKRTPAMNLATLKNISPILEKHFRYKLVFGKITRLREMADEEIYEKPNLEVADGYAEMQQKVFETYYKHLREVIVSPYLLIPNQLHDRTPRGEQDSVVSEKKFSSTGSQTTFRDHVLVGSELDLLRYLNHSAYYLLNDAALVEVALINFVSDILENEMNFRPFRNPDTCHEFIAEGAMGDNLDNECFRLKDSVYRLTGSASLSAFCAYRTSNSVRERFLPERFYTYGPRYIPPASLHEDGLYTAAQRMNVHLFLVANSEDQLIVEFDSVLRSLTSIYDRLGLDYRLCYARASELTLVESCRARIQLYSPYRNAFVDVARLSIYGDFISKRLRMFHHVNNFEKFFLFVLDGVVLSVPVLIANLLERSSDKMFIPDCIQPYMLNKSNKVEKN